MFASFYHQVSFTLLIFPHCFCQKFPFHSAKRQRLFSFGDELSSKKRGAFCETHRPFLLFCNGCKNFPPFQIDSLIPMPSFIFFFFVKQCDHSGVCLRFYEICKLNTHTHTHVSFSLILLFLLLLLKIAAAEREWKKNTLFSLSRSKLWNSFPIRNE